MMGFITLVYLIQYRSINSSSPDRINFFLTESVFTILLLPVKSVFFLIGENWIRDDGFYNI